MKTINRKDNLLMKILHEKCPHCGEGQVFQKKAAFFKIPVMNEECNACHYKFDREPGYFLGAMYISYGIAVIFGILTYLVSNALFPGWPLIFYPLAIILVVIAISKKNFKLSRVIYIHMFPW